MKQQKNERQHDQQHIETVAILLLIRSISCNCKTKCTVASDWKILLYTLLSYICRAVKS